jgi:hypothetical protein
VPPLGEKLSPEAALGELRNPVPATAACWLRDSIGESQGLKLLENINIWAIKVAECASSV